MKKWIYRRPASFRLAASTLIAVASVLGFTAHAHAQALPAGVPGSLKAKPAIIQPVLAAKAPSSATNTLTGDAARAELKRRGLYESLGAALARAQLSAIKIDAAAASSRGAEYYASNPYQKVRAWFGLQGVEIASAEKLPKCQKPWDIKVRLEGVGRTGALADARAHDIAASGVKILMSPQSGLLTEWYDNRENGIEQGFTVNKAPMGGSGPLRIVLKVAGTLQARATKDARGVTFIEPDGTPVVSYERVKAWDATGRDLPVHIEMGKGRELRLLADDSGARYPVTIDPLFANIQAKLIQEPGVVNFGSSIAISGTTALVAASGVQEFGSCIFTYNGTQWSQQVEIPAYGPVALSGDANTALIGATVFVHSGQLWTQQAQLTGSDTVAGDRFGTSVALSGTSGAGNTAVIGAPSHGTGSTGSAYVFVRNGTVWTQQAELTATDAVQLGTSAAMSSDGNTALVGAPYSGSSESGISYVFVRSGTVWSKQAELNDGIGTAGDQFGNACALSSDGNTALIGAYFYPNGETDGAAFVFVRSGTQWSQQTEFSDANGELSFFGCSVSLSPDGNTAVAGAREESNTGGLDGNGATGVAFLHTRSGTTWSHTATFVPSDGAGGDEFGTAVAVSGSVSLIGAPYHNVNIGSAYSYVNNGTQWSQQQELTPGAGANGDAFGYSVALSLGGNTALIGAPYHVPPSGQATGSAYVFENAGSQWNQEAELVAGDGNAGDEFGASVALSGTLALIGAPYHVPPAGQGSGSAYVFATNGTQWNQEAELTSTDGNAFGISAALSGSTALVGSMNVLYTQDRGSGVVFVNNGTQWTRQAELFNSGIYSEDNSVSVSADGNTALVGPYVFSRSGTQWSLQATLTPGVSGFVDYDSTLSADGTTALLGDPNTGLPNTAEGVGSVCVFSLNGTQWTQQAELTVGSEPGQFGASLALSSDGNTALIGASYGTGSAYIFVRNGTIWSPGPELSAGYNAAENDQLGFSVALSGSTALAGATQLHYTGYFGNILPTTGPGYVFAFAVGELPEITLQPVSQTVMPGQTVTFNVAAAGYTPLLYQWRMNQSPISGATGPSYTISSTGTANQGSYDVIVSNAGGSTTSAEAELVVNSLSQLAQVPPVPPPSDAFLLVNLSPSSFPDTTLLPGWRFVGEQQWRASDTVANGLVTGTYGVEYEPVPGYIQPLSETVDIVSGAPATVLDRNYYEDAGVETGALTVTLEPDSVAASGSAQWEFVGEDGTQWRNSGTTATSLPAGTYLVECTPVAGYATPAPTSVTIQDGITTSLEIPYYLPDATVGALPTVVPYQAVISGTNLPYAYVGQIQSDAGSATGFVVASRVVATAAHVVFDDATLSTTTGVQWLLQEYAGTYQPAPLIPRGFYEFAGYAAQRAAEGTPGQSSPASQNLDVAAMYFLQDAGNGGYSGYLASNSTDNEFLESSDLKILVGYPVDSIPAGEQGQVFATAPANVTFTRVPGVTASGTAVGVSSSTYRIYTTTDITSTGGNSGGPLCVQYINGNYYPAAIYLGGSQETVVRAIDGDVVDMFTDAVTSGNGGGNQGSGGILEYGSPTSTGQQSAGLQVTIAPAGAIAAGGEWRLKGASSYNATSTVQSGLTPGTYTLQFTTIAGFDTPSDQPVTLPAGEQTPVTFIYSDTLPPSITSGLSLSATGGQSIGYQITATQSPTSFGATSLPAGLAIAASNGLISGTPLTVGTFSIPISASNVYGTGTKTLVLTIQSPFPLWQAANFGANAGNPLIAGDTVTNNPAGIENLEAYGLGLNPFTAGAKALPGGGIVKLTGTNYLSLQFTRSSTAVDLTYTVLVTSNLGNPGSWTPVATYSGGIWSGPGTVVESGSAPYFIDQVFDSQPASSSPERFIRLNMSH